MSIYCVGATYDLQPNWQLFVQKPKAPSNYKDPAKIAAYVDEAWIRLGNAAAREPLTGKFAQVFVTKRSKSGEWEPGGKEGAPVLAQLENPEVIFGLDLRAFLRLAVVDYVTRKGALDHAYRWACLGDAGQPLLEDARAVRLIDPVRALTGLRHDEVSLEGFVNRFRLCFAAPENYLSTASGQCVLASVAAGLLGY